MQITQSSFYIFPINCPQVQKLKIFPYCKRSGDIWSIIKGWNDIKNYSGQNLTRSNYNHVSCLLHCTWPWTTASRPFFKNQLYVTHYWNCTKHDSFFLSIHVPDITQFWSLPTWFLYVCLAQVVYQMICIHNKVYWMHSNI